MLIVLRYDSSPVNPRLRNSPHKASSDNSDISTELLLDVLVFVNPCFLHVLHRYERPSAAFAFLANSDIGSVLPHTPHIFVCSIYYLSSIVIKGFMALRPHLELHLPIVLRSGLRSGC